MFERFTDSARHVVVLAQEHARLLGHNYVGTEHLLLGLTHDDEGAGGKVLRSFGLSQQEVRAEVELRIGQGADVPAGEFPLTPRAKKVLELALREALSLGHNYIGTEHLLLALIREGEGVAAHVLLARTPGLDAVRSAVIDHLSEGGGDRQSEAEMSTHEDVRLSMSSSARAAARSIRPADMPVCPSCSESLKGMLGYRILEAAGDEQGEARSVLFLYCKACGLAIDNWMLPEGG
jgi:ATP-dependent Clp protease ATP-binding subunit ClpC